MHLTINPLIFLYFLILDSISIVFTTLSTLFLDEHVVETIALQEIDTIVVPFVTLAHAHIGGNHDVSFTIMHTGDVGITDSAFNAGMLGLPGFIWKLLALALIWAYLHHFIAGIRHLWMDIDHSSVTKEFGKSSALVTLGLSIPLTVVLGAKLFGLY